MRRSRPADVPADPAGTAATAAESRRQQVLVKAGTLQNAILTSASFSIIATDENGMIQLFNAGAERMLGYTAAEVVNRISPSDMHDPGEVRERALTLSAELGTTIAPGFEALAYKASRGIEDTYELTYVRKDASRFPAIVSITALRDDAGGVIGYLLIGSDNSVRHRIDADLQRAMAEATKANLAKSDFLSSMSHELRTPLSAILGFAQLIESGTPPPTPTQQRSIEQILHAGWYLLDLINEILDLALIESGTLTLSMEPIALRDVLRECQAMIQPQASTGGAGLAFPKLDTAHVVLADRMRLKQVLINLLSNAIKYNRPRGNVIVSCEPIAPTRLRICVEDAGEGLTPAQQAQLFQPFNRLGKEGSGISGTGIGLVVCKRLIELMGGVIGVESTPGRGCVFWIELNLSEDRQHGPGVAGASATTFQATGDAPLRTLLYVEDNPANLMLVEDLVSRRPDLRMRSATDGQRGVEIARRELPEVILMDINLPGISGFGALALLRADPATAHIPVIALSANAMPRDVERGLQAGFFRYLTKPIKVREFMTTLDLALQNAVSRDVRSNTKDPS